MPLPSSSFSSRAFLGKVGFPGRHSFTHTASTAPHTEAPLQNQCRENADPANMHQPRGFIRIVCTTNACRGRMIIRPHPILTIPVGADHVLALRFNRIAKELQRAITLSPNRAITENRLQGALTSLSSHTVPTWTKRNTNDIADPSDCADMIIPKTARVL